MPGTQTQLNIADDPTDDPTFACISCVVLRRGVTNRFVIAVQEKRVPPPVPRKPGKGPVLLVRDRSLEGSQRMEARKRLLAAKRAAASQRQSSATECADSIEIYIPEAQTRL